MLSLFQKLSRKRREQSQRSKQARRRRLGAECLEDRKLLAGVVDVDTTTFPGSVDFVGDVSNNHITVVGTGVPGQLRVTGEGTLLTLDGGLQTFPELLINGITDSVFATLGNGQDTFELGDNGADTEVGFDVDIENDDDDTNILANVDIGNDLIVSRVDTAYSELTITESIIRNNVSIGNGDGDTKTSIEDSEIEGILVISNGDGDDATVIATTTIGAAQFVRPDDSGIPADPVVSISNGDGGSLTSFTDKNDADNSGFLPTGTLGRPTIFGGVDIVNGDTLPSGLLVPPPSAGGSTPDQLRTAVDIVVFNNTEVLGHLDIENFDGHTETVIVDSQIGTDTKRIDDPAVATSGYGEAVTIENGNGFDLTLVAGATLPYGLSLDNDFAALSTSTWGSETNIRDSEIGGRDSLILGADVALIFFGDEGDDVFNIKDTTAEGTTIDGMMTLDLFGGDDDVTLMGLPGTIEIESLDIDGSSDDDSVYLENVEIESMIMVSLADGVDLLEIRDGVTLPSGLLGTIDLDGGLGADFYHVETGISDLSSFEISVP